MSTTTTPNAPPIASSSSDTANLFPFHPKGTKDKHISSSGSRGSALSATSAATWETTSILQPIPSSPGEMARSRSAPPLPTGGESLFSFDLSGLTAEEKAARSNPNYYYYYHDRKRMNPRLPPPLYNGDCRGMFDGPTRATTTNRDFIPKKMDITLKAPTPTRTGCIGDRGANAVPEEKGAGTVVGGKSVMDRIQEDFPRTASPIYDPHQQFVLPLRTQSKIPSVTGSSGGAGYIREMKGGDESYVVGPGVSSSTLTDHIDINVDHKFSSSTSSRFPYKVSPPHSPSKTTDSHVKRSGQRVVDHTRDTNDGLECSLSSLRIDEKSSARHESGSTTGRNVAEISATPASTSTSADKRSNATRNATTPRKTSRSAYTKAQGYRPYYPGGTASKFASNATPYASRSSASVARHGGVSAADPKHFGDAGGMASNYGAMTNAASPYIHDPNVYAAQMAAAAASAQYFSQLAANMNMMHHHHHPHAHPMHHMHHLQGNMQNHAAYLMAHQQMLAASSGGAMMRPHGGATNGPYAARGGNSSSRGRRPGGAGGDKFGDANSSGFGGHYAHNHHHNHHSSNSNGGGHHSRRHNGSRGGSGVSGGGGGHSHSRGGDRAGSGGRRSGSNLEFDDHAKLEDMKGRLFDFSRDQFGSRFLQQKIVSGTDSQKRAVFEELRQHIRVLMRDVFGNYVIQKLLRHGLPEHVNEIAVAMRSRVLDLSLDTYGCRVVQTAFQVVNKKMRAELAQELRPHVKRCVKNQNANHVIQKCIENVESPEKDFIIDTFVGEVYDFATHPYGCRVIQRILEYCSAMSQTKALMREIEKAATALMQDMYGNYVIQHIIQHGTKSERAALIDRVRGNMLSFSQHKFASNVVECCLKYGSLLQRKDLVDEILKKDECGITPLEIMIKDPFANYVVQKVVDVVDARQRAVVTKHIKAQAQYLRRYTYGKHIISKMEKMPNAGTAAAE
eukprot:g944.t1